MKRIYIIILLLSYMPILLLASTDKQGTGPGDPYIKNYFPKDYNAHPQNFAITQSREGLMCFANFAGVLLYDGSTWALQASNKMNRINDVTVNEAGWIYAVAKGEYLRLDAGAGGQLGLTGLIDANAFQILGNEDLQSLYFASSSTYIISPNKICKYNSPDTLIIKADGEILKSFLVRDTLYLNIRNKGLARLEGEHLVLLDTRDVFVGATEITSMLPLHDGSIMLSSLNQGLFLMQGNTITEIRTAAHEEFIKSQIQCAVMLNDGNIAFGSNRNGILVTDKQGNLINIINKQSGLQNDNINALFTDAEGLLWAALNNGIARIMMPSPVSFFSTEKGIKGGVTKTLTNKHHFLAGSYQGLFVFNKKYRSFMPVPGIYTACWDLASSKDKTLIAASQGLLLLDEKMNIQILDPDFCYSLCKSKKYPSRSYAGFSNGIKIFEADGKGIKLMKHLPEPNEDITELIEDNKGRLWIKAKKGGIIMMDGDNFTVQNFVLPDSATNAAAYHLLSFRNNLLVSTPSGFYYFNEEVMGFEKFRLFKKADNDDKWWYELKDDDMGGFWITNGNQRGIAHYNEDYEKDFPYLKTLQDKLIWTISGNNKGIWWLGGPDGLIRINTKEAFHINKSYNTLITKIILNNDSILFSGYALNPLQKSIEEKKESIIKLPYGLNSLKISFSSTSFFRDESNTFSYFLENFDKKWPDWDSRTEKEYTNLPHGDYHFQLRSNNILNTEGNPAGFHFYIPRPWYLKWWAYIVYASILALVIYLFVRWRSEKLRREKQQLEKVIQQRTSELVKQKEEIEMQSKQLGQKNEELEKIHNMVRSINSEIDFTQLLNAVLERLRSVEGISKASALIRDKEKDCFVFQASRGWDIESLKKIEFSPQQAEERYLKNCDEAFEEVFVLKDKAKVNPLEEAGIYEKTASMIVLTIREDNEIQGFIILENMKKSNAFSDTTIDFIRNIREHILSAFIKTNILQNLQHTLDNLKEAQDQLIQSEKLASLGQLTAGIAHEIQNPLNFVNNFSELTISLAEELREILDEIKENLQEDEMDELDEVIADIESNAGKINEHGKRAERIVKGMLQHSRGKTGEFQDTDFNQLVEEYVNLAYHGMRAENKQFNAKFSLDLDPEIGRIRIVPQDFSRVILNIVNNACYAVHEKSLKTADGYSPEIIITTRQKAGEVEVRIKDNGTGMPQKLIDKIFNPFFTTKPTGKGTGLGLSMSYDIIKQVHKGSIKVLSTDGESTEFIISIPAKK